MEYKLSQLRPLIRELLDRGYKRTFKGIYTKTLRAHGLAIQYSVSIYLAMGYHDGPIEYINRMFVEHMDQLAKEETRKRLGEI